MYKWKHIVIPNTPNINDLTCFPGRRRYDFHPGTEELTSIKELTERRRLLIYKLLKI